ncbi:MAG: cell division protein FtsK [Chloroflexi bacterium]|nr:cell division protein FtsK [Chloroflexota bacterium]|tara:strand:+ start:445 stop:2607 length:2163 start_codon:yes stop_codon:yes gene_type:complete
MANSKYTFLTKLIILVAISFAITYLYIFRNIEEMKEFFGWSFIPSILATFPIIINIFFRKFIRFWKYQISFILLCASLSGILGIFYAPIGSFSGESIGGELGIFVSRSYMNWNRFDVSLLDYLISWMRVILFILLAISLIKPKLIKITTYYTYNFSSKFIVKFLLLVTKLSKYTVINIINSIIKKNNIPNDTEEEIEINEKDINNKKELSQSEPMIASNKSKDQEIPKNNFISNNSETDSTKPEELLTSHNYEWIIPSLDNLKRPLPGGISESEVQLTSKKIESSLKQFGIEVTVDQVKKGPTVTMYGLSPGWKGKTDDKIGQRVRVDTILNREKDIALSLASPNLRFEAPVPGESVVGIEVPNKSPNEVTLRSIMDTNEWKEFAKDNPLPVPLGLGSGGEPVMTDLSKMPHTLVAGSTGSGKSVCMNSIITGLIMTKTPDELRIVMIDPKRVELTPYEGIPHLYTPVVVESDQAVIVLKSLVKEMMERFKILENFGVKNILTFNKKSDYKMPYLVILVDELADLMLSASGEVERLLVRLAQLGRATGVHLVLATQRPSVDVVTGLIKANFPSRISFAVMSQIDSRTILDSVGADKLLGKGDMLFKPIDKPKPSRVQGAFVSDIEVDSVVNLWKKNTYPNMKFLELSNEEENGINNIEISDNDSLFNNALELSKSQKTLSVSFLQRRLRIGYPRAARLMDELEEAGVVGPGEPGKARPVI